MSELNIDLDKLEDQARKGYMADARFLAFVSPATILDLIQLARCAPILTPRQAIPRVTLDDARIIEALNARGIDTYPSKYGFDTVQVSATSVSTLREVIQDLAPVSTPQQSAQRASVATAKFWALLEAVCNAWLELDSSFEGGEATFAAAGKLKEAQTALIAHINAWGSAGSGAIPRLQTKEQAQQAIQVCNAFADTLGDDEQHPLFPMMDALMDAIAAWECADPELREFFAEHDGTAPAPQGEQA